MSNNEILSRLLALNLERATRENAAAEVVNSARKRSKIT
jgi:hypothetical protein